MKKIHINAINHRLLQNEGQFISDCDRLYKERLSEIADEIERKKNEMPIVLLSGPSGSGKTTTALKLEEILDSRNIHTHTISMDNYFLPKDRFDYEEDGNIDYESPKRIDIALLNKHMEMLSNCEEITVPDFNFATQTQNEGQKLRREKNDIIVFEGIHALNPQITGSAGAYSHKMYVSVRTRLEYAESDCECLLHPAYIRLMRRIIRDGLFRSRPVSETLDMFDSVENGEVKYIMPYKNLADFSVDTFIPYEIAVYKSFLLGRLENVKDTYEGFERFQPMIDALQQTGAVNLDCVPQSSLTREFIGGSCYKY